VNITSRKLGKKKKLDKIEWYNRSTSVKQRKRLVERSFRGSHRSQHGGHIRSLVANHITEFKVLLSDLLGNGEVNKAAN
jgi:hypothetical protein